MEGSNRLERWPFRMRVFRSDRTGPFQGRLIKRGQPTIKMKMPIYGVLMLGERDAYVASHGSRALGVAICDTVLRNVAIGLLDVSVKRR